MALALLHPALATLTPALILLLELRLRLGRPPAFRALRAALHQHRALFTESERALRPPRDTPVLVNYEDGKRAFEALRHHDDRRSAELFRLHERLIDQQTRRHLARHTLRGAGLAAVPGRVVLTLEKHKLGTANDVAALRKHRPRGVEPAHLAALTRWEFSLLNRFVPDLDDPDYRAAFDALQRRLDDEHTDAMNRLVLSRDWLAERLVADRRRRQSDLETYRERFTVYARDLVLYRAVTRRWPPRLR